MSEWVSAVCDGEAIPREAAEHVRGCAACKERLREYVAMSAELRVMAGLSIDESLRRRVWAGRKNGLANLWWKGWETMRIPRLAFGGLVAAVVGLGSVFAVLHQTDHLEAGDRGGIGSVSSEEMRQLAVGSR